MENPDYSNSNVRNYERSTKLIIQLQSMVKTPLKFGKVLGLQEELSHLI